MTDNEIIKALECCVAETEDACVLCPLHDERWCVSTRNEAILDLIRRQKAEIERYERESNEAFDKWRRLDERTKERYAELYEEAKVVVRAEAVKEFAERLKSKHRRILDYDEAGFSAPTDIVYVETIDNLVKEFTEEKT